jgi:hypothetical protein
MTARAALRLASVSRDGAGFVMLRLALSGYSLLRRLR